MKEDQNQYTKSTEQCFGHFSDHLSREQSPSIVQSQKCLKGKRSRDNSFNEYKKLCCDEFPEIQI